MKMFYLISSIIGFIIPHLYLGNFIINNGLDLFGFVNQMFANSISSSFSVDLILTSFAFWGFVYHEAHEKQMKKWWGYIPMNIFLGLSFTLPLFMYRRQVVIEADNVQN